MQTLRAARTAVTPEIVFSRAENKLLIDGECYPENPLPFFTPIVGAIKAHLESHRPGQFDAHMRLQYVNSASTKGLQTIISVLNDAGLQGTNVNVYWTHDPEDDAMEELGQDLVEDFTNVVLIRQPVAA